MAVLFIDLDRFKPINDFLGHEAGDEVLGTVADRLRAAVRPADTIGRLAGDEFIVLCEDLPAEHDAVDIAARVVATLSEPGGGLRRAVPRDLKRRLMIQKRRLRALHNTGRGHITRRRSRRMTVPAGTW